MTPETLRELQERVKAASGPDRELDGRIMFDLFAKPVASHPKAYLWPEDDPSWSFALELATDPFKARADLDGETIAWPLGDGRWLLMNSLRVPKLTASLDAALALFGRAMPGVRWGVRDERFGSITAVVYPPLPPRPPYNPVAAYMTEEPLGDGGVYAHAPTPALALLSALLSALSQGADNAR